MAPKKNIVKADTPENQVKKVKPVVKNLRVVKPKPSVLKLNIPVQSIEDTNELKIPRKKMTPQIKLDLANQVAHAQLIKPVSDTSNPPEKKKRGRKKRLPQCVENTTEETVTEPSEPKIPVVTKKRMTKKKAPVEETPIDYNYPTVKKSTVPKKRLADSTVQKLPRKRPKMTNEKPTGTGSEATVTNNKFRLRLRKRPYTIKGKVQCELANSPNLSILHEEILKNNDSDKATADAVKDVPAPVESRKTSMTSNSSLSWTKDISDSSTTTCITVTSKDFVRIDRKLPVISVNALNPHLKEKSSSSDSESSDSSVRSNSVKDFECDANSHLNLSTSSLSITNDSSEHKDDHIKKIGDALDKLSAKLKHFDHEMIDWIGYESHPVDAELKIFETKIFRVLKEEHEVIMHCNQLKKVLTDDGTETIKHYNHKESEDTNFVKPNEITNIQNSRKVNDNEHPQNESNNQCEESNNFVRSKQPTDSLDSEVITSENTRNMSSDHNCDEEDALSIFAESISSLYSLKNTNNSIDSMSNSFEEYVPKPIAKDTGKQSVTTVYRPTKIVRNDNNHKAICEKQSADSTSIKEFERVSLKLPENKTKDNLLASPSQRVSGDKLNISEKKVLPGLLATRFEIHGKKNVVFNNVCFFNLIKSCKNEECWYPHIEPKPIDIKCKLVRMNEVSFIHEYMLLRNWPDLRRKYGMCFVEEAERRDLTRVLVEMVLDFNAKATKSIEDVNLKVEVNERVLLHLNDVDLVLCEDILLCRVHRQLLCDILMQAIASTQNFSRFKSVFFNLTQFMRRYSRVFALSVAEQILERVCILPLEEPLIRAVLTLIQNTDSRILQNSMIPQFEKHLLCLDNTELFDEFMALKEMARLSQPFLAPYPSSPQMVIDVDPLAAVQMEREKRYTSPDTTNLHNVNRPPLEPVITRTVNLNPLPLSNLSPTLEIRPNHFQHRKGFVHKRFPPRRGMDRRPRFQYRTNHRQVMYSPTKFPRHPGPNF